MHFAHHYIMLALAGIEPTVTQVFAETQQFYAERLILTRIRPICVDTLTHMA